MARFGVYVARNAEVRWAKVGRGVVWLGKRGRVFIGFPFF